MNKNILIICSDYRQDRALIDLFSEISGQGYKLRFVVNSRVFANILQEKGWAYSFAHQTSGKSSKFRGLLFFLLLPGRKLAEGIKLIYQKIKYHINIVICLAWQDKIIYAPLCKLLKIKIIWIEYPGGESLFGNGLRKKLYLRRSRRASIITFDSDTRAKLINLKIQPDIIHYLPLGIKNQGLLRQDSIFSGLAEREKGIKNKYFTIGTILPAIGEDNTEILCQAIKDCLSVIPQLQLIIVGDKNRKQNLSWFIKKIGINDIVWFVGEPSHPEKWLAGFDIFVLTGNKLSLPDLSMVIKAAAFGLPIIGPENIGLQDAVIDNRNGYLINTASGEALSQSIIRLQQNPHLRKRLGENGKELVNRYFQLNDMAQRLMGIFDNQKI